MMNIHSTDLAILYNCLYRMPRIDQRKIVYLKALKAKRKCERKCGYNVSIAQERFL